MDSLLHSLQSVDPVLIYAVLFASSFVENIFPPSPSDMIIVFGGSLVGIGVISFGPAVFWATLGSAVGFIVMYAVGKWFGERILERYRPRFLPLDAMHKVEAWFRRFGYWIIVGNRFLSGTRAVISFLAGMSEMTIVPTTSLCAVSALIWNTLLLAGGYSLGRNWERIGFYLGMYSEVVTGVLLVAALAIVGRIVWKRRMKGSVK